MRALALGAAAVLALVTTGVLAETLGEIAEREKQKRKSDGSTKIYGESDLRPLSSRPTPRSRETGSTSAAATPTPAPEAAREDRAASEATWRNRALSARNAITAGEAHVKEIERELAERKSLLRPDYTRMLADPEVPVLEEKLAKAKANLAESRRALDDLEEDARRQNIPPGWLRER